MGMPGGTNTSHFKGSDCEPFESSLAVDLRIEQPPSEMIMNNVQKNCGLRQISLLGDSVSPAMETNRHMMSKIPRSLTPEWRAMACHRSLSSSSRPQTSRRREWTCVNGKAGGSTGKQRLS